MYFAFALFIGLIAVWLLIALFATTWEDIFPKQ